MLVYLASAMTYYDKINQFHKAIQWRVDAINKLKYTEATSQIKVFDPTIKYDNNLKYDSKGVVLQNKLYLDRADIILVNLEYLEYSAGTMFELFYAWLNHKPVVAFGNSDIINQPHIKEALSVKFDTLDEAINYISDMYCQAVR